MGLFTPAWFSENEEKALKAVGKLSVQETLAEVALKSKSEKVCLEALGKLTDQQKLFDVAWNSSSANVRSAAMDKISDESLLLRLAKEYSGGDIVRGEAVKRLNNQNELLGILKNDKSGYVRAEAIRNLDENHLDLNYLVKLAMAAVSEYMLSPKDALAAVERIGDEKILYDIALKAADGSIKRSAAEKITDSNLLAEFLIHTNDFFLFKDIAKRITDQELRKKIIREAQIEDKNVLKDLTSAEDLLQKCLDEKDAALVDAVYTETWDICILKKLKGISGDKDIAEQIDLRIKTAEHMAMLRDKGMPAELNAKTNEYIQSIAIDTLRYSQAKRTVAQQGRKLDFDAIYDKPDLQAAVLSASGISLQYFHGGSLMSGMLFNNFGESLSQNAKESVWAVIARLQLADSENVLKRIKPDISQQEAEKLIYDIFRLWYEKMS